MDRLSAVEATELLQNCDLLTLGEMASNMRKRLHPDGVVSFVVDRNINYTNICTCRCKFCAFWKDRDAPGSYVISDDALFEKIEGLRELGGTQVLLQGGLHPDLQISYYEDLLRKIKSYPVWIHGFSPPEIANIASISGVSVGHVLERLMDAGLDSMPGAGAELLIDEVRSSVSPNKIDAAMWLDIMRTAHGLALPTTATMMFKMEDTASDIVHHLEQLRALQDDTGGFTAFIPWPFQPANTELGGQPSTAVNYLRVLSISRLFLDNIDNIQVSWVTQGLSVGQTGLLFGGNDFGSLMIEENVVAACSTVFTTTVEGIVHQIQKAGFKACQRDMRYNTINEF